MKIRSGFVSNSSSSSFVVGVGVVKDLDKFLAKAEQGGVGVSRGTGYRDFDIMQAKTVKGTLSEESFRGDVVSVKLEGLDPETWLFKYYHSEGDDSDFVVYDDDGDFDEMNYDIDSDFFNEAAQAAIGIMCDPSLVEKVDWTFGAGRNG